MPSVFSFASSSVAGIFRRLVAKLRLFQEADRRMLRPGFLKRRIPAQGIGTLYPVEVSAADSLGGEFGGDGVGVEVPGFSSDASASPKRKP